MSGGGSRGTRPVKSYVDPRIEIYEPTATSPYFRIVAYDDRDRRVVNTTGGRTLKAAKRKASTVAKQLRRRRRTTSADPSEVLVHEEAEEWLVPTNHRTRENKPWSNRHAENMVREWELRISPHIPRRTTVDELNDRQLWVRILNEYPPITHLRNQGQNLIERHLDVFLGVQFLASEYSTGRKHRGRIDTLGLDENDSPVIIE